MTSKIKILGQNLALSEGHFDNFGGQKSRFLDFLKFFLGMFRSSGVSREKPQGGGVFFRFFERG